MRGEHLDVSIADGAFTMMSLYVDEYLATGDRTGTRSLHPHRPLRLLRHLLVRGRQVHLGRCHRVRFWANLCELLGLSEYA
ncbi:MAG: hypothetical protein M5U19_10325 [Microthrixaceae bacterium]|nr:hypothetical protein [Microthrixaceae bacterium]